MSFLNTLHDDSTAKLKKYNVFRNFSLYKDFLEAESNDGSTGISKTKILMEQIGYNITYHREEGIWNR